MIRIDSFLDELEKISAVYSPGFMYVPTREGIDTAQLQREHEELKAQTAKRWAEREPEIQELQGKQDVYPAVREAAPIVGTLVGGAGGALGGYGLGRRYGRPLAGLVGGALLGAGAGALGGVGVGRLAERAEEKQMEREDKIREYIDEPWLARGYSHAPFWEVGGGPTHEFKLPYPTKARPVSQMKQELEEMESGFLEDPEIESLARQEEKAKGAKKKALQDEINRRADAYYRKRGYPFHTEHRL